MKPDRTEKQVSRDLRRGAAIGAGVGLLFVASLTLIAAGDPGGWAPWRVALCSAWAVALCGLFGAAMGKDGVL